MLAPHYSMFYGRMLFLIFVLIYYLVSVSVLQIFLVVIFSLLAVFVSFSLTKITLLLSPELMGETVTDTPVFDYE